MKKLPKIFQNKIPKNIDNNKKSCIVDYVSDNKVSLKNNTDKNRSENIEHVIHKIFNGLGYSFNIPVTIKTKIKTYNTYLILRRNNKLVSIDNDVIPISDIIDIQINKDH